MRDRDLYTLPKAELHLHLLGAMRLATLVDLSAEAGFEVPDPRGFSTFAEFQSVFPAVYRTLQKPEHLLRLVREVVEDAAADGVVWVQPHFDPHLHPRFGSPAEVMEMVLAEGHATGERHGVGFGITVAAMRHRGPEKAETLAAFAADYADRGVHALGLTGDELAFPPGPYAKAFAIAREAGLTAAPHAGEVSGPQSVQAAVELLGATRIAHGVRAVEDPDVLRLLVEREVSLDVCLTSNHLLGVAALDSHPLPALLSARVRCTLGADDPLMFGVGLLEEYRIARDRLGLGDEQLAAMARTSVANSGAPADRIAAWSAKIDTWLG